MGQGQPGPRVNSVLLKDSFLLSVWMHSRDNDVVWELCVGVCVVAGCRMEGALTSLSEEYAR